MRDPPLPMTRSDPRCLRAASEIGSPLTIPPRLLHRGMEIKRGENITGAEFLWGYRSRFFAPSNLEGVLTILVLG